MSNKDLIIAAAGTVSAPKVYFEEVFVSDGGNSNSNNISAVYSFKTSGILLVLGSFAAGATANYLYPALLKVNPSTGIILARYNMANSAESYTSMGMSIDSSETYAYCHVQGSNNVYVKVDLSTMTAVWKKNITPGFLTFADSNYVYSCSYLGGFVRLSTSTGALVDAKITNNGTTPNSYSTIADSSGNIYCMSRRDITGAWNLGLVKYNSSGGVIWQKEFSLTGRYLDLSNKVNAILQDSVGNIYISLVNGGGSYNSVVIVKINSSGTILWQKMIGTTTQILTYKNIAIDSLDNIYLHFVRDSNTYIVKFDSNGNLQWQRSLANATGFTSLSIDNIGSSFIISGTFGSQAVLIKLPLDGTKTGITISGTLTYNSVTTEAINPSSLAFNTTAYTTSTPTLPTIATSSLGETNVNINPTITVF